MKDLAPQLDRSTPDELRAWVIGQLRGENPAGLRQLYEAPHVPIAAVYRFLTPTTRESLQYVIYDLMRQIASGASSVSAAEAFALVDPVFASSSLRPKVVTLLLTLVERFGARPGLRHPTLVALLRIGFKGPNAFWKGMLRDGEDDALMVILEGVADTSLADLFDVLSGLQWSTYVADCVASLVPWLIEEHGTERVMPRLMRILAAAPPETRRPVLAIARPQDVPLPDNTIDWMKAVERYVTGASDEQPWNALEMGAQAPRWKSFADDRIDFQRALDEWVGRWSPTPDTMAEAMRGVDLLQRHSSPRRIVAIIGALDAFRLHRATAAHLPFVQIGLSAITMNPVAVKQLWHEDPEIRKTYERWLEYALGTHWLREPTLRELVNWLDLPDLAPFYRLVADGHMTVDELADFARQAAASEATVVRMLYEVHQSAMFDGRRDIIQALFKDEGLVLRVLDLQRTTSLGSPAALMMYARQAEVRA